MNAIWIINYVQKRYGHVSCHSASRQDVLLHEMIQFFIKAAKIFSCGGILRTYSSVGRVRWKPSGLVTLVVILIFDWASETSFR